MSVNVKGRNIDVTPALKEYVEKKITKVTKQFKTVGDISAVLKVEKGNHIVEITVPASGILLRAQETTKDMYSSIDLVVEKIERQIHKYKTRLMKRKYSNFADTAVPAPAPAAEAADEGEFEIIKNKRFIMHPMTPEEAIGKTKRTDYPILTGKDVMIQAEYKGFRGQAFTDAPSAFEGMLEDILQMDIEHDPHDRGIFIATVNAVMASLGLCCGTVHCRTEGPELCAQDMLNYLESNYPDVKRIALVGFQPSLLEMLSKSKYDVRVMDLNPNNIGQLKFGIRVEDGTAMKEEIRDSYAELILCTGSTLCNGSIIDYLDLDKEVLFFGTTTSGAAPLLGLKRVCFADKYE